jgi:hypothetical protein
LKHLMNTLSRQFPEGAGVEDLYRDKHWNSLVREIQTLGIAVKAGDFRAAYVDKADGHDFIILPGEEATVISVSPKCPRDRLMEALSE